MATPRTHKRFLDYRDRYVYFGRGKPALTYAQFEALDDEHATLAAKGEGRADEEEARFVEVTSLLLRD